MKIKKIPIIFFAITLFAILNSIEIKANSLGKVKPTSIVSVTKSGKNSVKIEWKKITSASGYKIYRSCSLKGKYKYTKINSNKVSLKIKLKKNKDYYFKIRTYKRDRKKNFYSKLSPTIKIRINSPNVRNSVNTDKISSVRTGGMDYTEEEGTSDEISNEILVLMNKHRLELGLKPLKMTKKMNAAADIRAREMVRLYSHTRPDGTKFSTSFKQIGIIYRYTGENLMYSLHTAQEFYNSWNNSEGHRKNMENSKFIKVGIATYIDEKGTIYCAQEFAG